MPRFRQASLPPSSASASASGCRPVDDAPSMGPQAGMPVTTQVTLVEPLAGGSMGSVWLARHRSLDTPVAVKFLNPELARHDPSLVARFAQEASLAAKIRSAHVVTMLDQGIAPTGQPFIIMELLEGESLKARLDREPRLELELVATLLEQGSRALTKAHALQIVHRDIKPANLFLAEEHDGVHMKLLDFGVAKQRGRPSGGAQTQEGALVGTPHTMSPEQIVDAKNVGPDADLWALAVVAYRCITGRYPFLGRTVGAVCTSIIALNFPRPSTLDPALPRLLDLWFRVAFARDAEHRFVDLEEMTSTFREAIRAPR